MTALIALLVPILLFAQSSSENFSLTKSVLDAGGGAMNSTHFSLISAFGQPTPVGPQSSESFGLNAGFLAPSFQQPPLSSIQRLVIKEATPNAELYWEARAGAGSYSIYRDSIFTFTPAPSNIIATVTDTFYVDSGVLSGPELQQYYIVIVNSP